MQQICVEPYSASGCGFSVLLCNVFLHGELQIQAAALLTELLFFRCSLAVKLCVISLQMFSIKDGPAAQRLEPSGTTDGPEL